MSSAPAIGARQRFTPPPTAAIDWSHPLAQGLYACVLPAHGIELVRGRRATYASTPTGGSGITPTNFGNGWYVAQNSHGQVYDVPAPTTYPVSVTEVGRRIGTGNATAHFGWLSSPPLGSETAPFVMGLYDQMNTLSFPNGSAFVTQASNFLMASGENYVVTGQFGNGVVEGYKNGTRTVSASVSRSNPSGLGAHLVVGTYTIRYGDNHVHNLCLAHTRLLSAAEHAMLYADPYCFLRW